MRELDSLDCIYVPSLYEVAYEGVRIKEFKAAKRREADRKAAKARELSAYPVPQSFIYTPDTEFDETYCVEVERGCGKGCRFCAAGFLYLPPRMREPGPVMDSVDKGIGAHQARSALSAPPSPSTRR